MKLEIVLTVTQSKRLIAKGVRNHPAVVAAMEHGNIGICRGTTCSYVAEEFLGRPVERFSYTTGLTLPPRPEPAITPAKEKIADIIIRKGDIHTDGPTVFEAAKDMNPGDVIIKGANALNYRSRIAGCLIGHPAGGYMGGFWGPLFGRKLKLIIPVGLEKEIAEDILEVSELTLEGPGNALMPMTGAILTEIEAIGILTGAGAYQIAAGGIRGAEGAIRLLVSGDDDQIAKMRALCDSLEAEEPF